LLLKSKQQFLGLLRLYQSQRPNAHINYNFDTNILSPKSLVLWAFSGLFDWIAQDFLAYKEIISQFSFFGNAPFLKIVTRYSTGARYYSIV